MPCGSLRRHRSCAAAKVFKFSCACVTTYVSCLGEACQGRDMLRVLLICFEFGDGRRERATEVVSVRHLSRDGCIPFTRFYPCTQHALGALFGPSGGVGAACPVAEGVVCSPRDCCAVRTQIVVSTRIFRQGLQFCCAKRVVFFFFLEIDRVAVRARGRGGVLRGGARRV